MGRLIDADSIIEVLDRAKENCTDLRDIAIILRMQGIIDAQPTAYDVEKVVEQLEKLKQNFVSNAQMLSANQIEKAIEIVRKGGVE